jgi:hypothetical protein
MLWAQSALTTAHRSMKARLSAEQLSVRGTSPGFHLRMAELSKAPRAPLYLLTSAQLSTIKCKSKSGDSRLCETGPFKEIQVQGTSSQVPNTKSP